MLQFTEYIAFFAGGVSLLVAAGQWCVPHRRLENLNLFALFLVLGLLLFQYGCILNGFIFKKPYLFYFHFTFLYCIGPLLYYAYYLVIRVDDSLPKIKLLLLLPSVIYCIIDIFFIRSDYNLQIAIIDSLFFDKFGIYHWLRIAVIAALLLDSLYIIFLLHRLFQFWQLHELTSIMVVTLIFSISSFAGLMILLASYYMRSLIGIQISVIIMAILLIAAYLVGQHRPEFLQLLIREARRKRYERTLLKGCEVESLCKKLKQLMDEERLYLDEDVTLKEVANELNITAHQLSELLNVKLKMNFNSFINQYRIKEAKKMLIEESERSVLSIAYAVGFNSKSSFYEAFSRFIGKTPVQYRREKENRAHAVNE